MAKAKNSWEVMAADAAKRVDQARELGEQLTFLGDEAGAAPVDTIDRSVGRPKGAKNKGSSELRKWLAANGYRMPEDMLAQMAGLGSRDPALVIAMQQTEQVLVWAFEGARHHGGKRDGQAIVPTPHQKLQVFNSIYTILLRASDALLPYAAAKASPDVQVNQQTNILMPAPPAPARNGDQARVIDGKSVSRMMPADAAYEMQQKQEVSDTGSDDPDAKGRTE